MLGKDEEGRAWNFSNMKIRAWTVFNISLGWTGLIPVLFLGPVDNDDNDDNDDDGDVDPVQERPDNPPPQPQPQPLPEPPQVTPQQPTPQPDPLDDIPEAGTTEPTPTTSQQTSEPEQITTSQQPTTTTTTSLPPQQPATVIHMNWDSDVSATSHNTTVTNFEEDTDLAEDEEEQGAVGWSTSSSSTRGFTPDREFPSYNSSSGFTPTQDFDLDSDDSGLEQHTGM